MNKVINCPEHIEILIPNFTYDQLKAQGYTEQQMVNEGYAQWIFKLGDWVWTTTDGWYELCSCPFGDSDEVHLFGSCGDAGRTFTINGYEYITDKYPSLFKFDPLKGTKPPEVEAAPTMQSVEDWVKPHGSICGLNYHSFMIPKTDKNTIELDGIVESVDFESMVRELISQGFENLRGGQKADTTWYISGTK